MRKEEQEQEQMEAYIFSRVVVRRLFIPDILKDPNSSYHSSLANNTSHLKASIHQASLTKAIRRSRRMIRTRVSALAPIRCFARILCNHLCNVLDKSATRMVRHDGRRLTWLPAHHVLVEEADDGLLLRLVLFEDILCAHEADLLGGVEMELDCILRLPALGGSDAQGLEHHGASGGVVVGSGGAGIGAAGGAVEVGAENHEIRVGAGEDSDCGRLVPAVLVLRDFDVFVGGGCLFGGFEDVVGGGDGLFSARVAGVEAEDRQSQSVSQLDEWTGDGGWEKDERTWRVRGSTTWDRPW